MNKKYVINSFLNIPWEASVRDFNIVENFSDKRR